MQRIVKIAIVTCMAFLLCFCAENPVTKTRELMLFSEKDEVALGKGLDRDVRKEYGVYDDISVTNYVQKVGKKVAQVSHRSNLDFHFSVVDMDEVNAFALPGGYIYVTRGLLCYLNNEAQLAGVIGHEIGHVSYRHSMKALQSDIGTNILLNIIAMGTGSQFWAQVSNMMLGAIMAGYSRTYENQADELAVDYMLKAHYDPYQMRDFLYTIKRMEEGRVGFLLGIFASHPLTEERIKNVQNVIKQKIDDYRDKALKIDEEEFLQIIDGMPLEKEKGWVKDKNELKNGKVGMAVPLRRGLIIEKGENPDELILFDRYQNYVIGVTPLKGRVAQQEAIEEFEKKKSLQKKVYFGLYEDVQNTTLCIYRLNGSDLKVAFIDMFPHLLAVSFVEKASSRGELVWKEIIKKARKLDAQEMVRVSPGRIKVYEVEKRQTLKELLKSLYKDEKTIKKISVTNGLQEDYVLEPGKRIKLIITEEESHLLNKLEP